MITNKQASINNTTFIDPSTKAIVQLNPNQCNNNTWSTNIINQQRLKMILNLVTENGEIAMYIIPVAKVDVCLNEECPVPSYLLRLHTGRHRLFLQCVNKALHHRSFRQFYTIHLH